MQRRAAQSGQHLLPDQQPSDGDYESILAIECLSMLRKQPWGRRAASRVQGVHGGSLGGFGLLQPRISLALLRKLQRARECIAAAYRCLHASRPCVVHQGMVHMHASSASAACSTTTPRRPPPAGRRRRTDMLRLAPALLGIRDRSEVSHRQPR